MEPKMTTNISCGRQMEQSKRNCFIITTYEGQGAEHSSARMERYLQLCARHNMYVADCTTPITFTCCEDNENTFRKPLVTQSLLRDPRCVSTVEELATGSKKIDDTKK
jgi:2-oxoglutarate dehydrogenase E1 component